MPTRSPASAARRAQVADAAILRARGVAHRMATLLDYTIDDDGVVVPLRADLLTEHRLGLLREAADDLITILGKDVS